MKKEGLVLALTHNECWYRKICNRVGTELCTDVCIQFYEMLHLLSYSGIPENLYKPIELVPEQCDLAAFKELSKIKSNIKQEVQNGLNLYIYSQNCGNAKTSWAIKLLQAYFNSVSYGNGLKPRGFFIHTPSYLIDHKTPYSGKDDNRLVSIKDDMGTELVTTNNLLNVDIIVWDEIGVAGMSNYDFINWLSIVDQRILRGKSNIFTGNLSETALVDMVGEKFVSRIYNNSRVIEFKGADRRGLN